MSVLRAPGDGSISQGMGALGQALGQMFDPRLRWEAYELQQRMMLQRLQMQELQSKLGARTDLINKALTDPNFARALNTPALQAELNYMIQSGASGKDIDEYIASHALANAPDVNDPNEAKRNIGNAIVLTKKPYESTTMPIVGPVTAAQSGITSLQTQQAQEQAKARGQALGAVTKLAPADILGGEGVSGGNIAPMSFNWGPNGPTVNVGPASSASGANIQPPASAGAGAEVNSGQSGASTGQSGASTGNTLAGLNPVTIEGAKGQQKFVMDDASAMQQKQRVVNQAQGIINDIRQLEQLTKTGGFTGQVSAAFRQHLQQEYGLIVGDAASAQAAIGSLLVDTLGNVRGPAGLTTVRVGEINPVIKPMIGSPSMPPGALDTILAQEQSGLDTDQKQIANAYAYMKGAYGALGSGAAETTYLTNKDNNEKGYAATRDKNNKDFNTIVAQAQALSGNQPAGAPVANSGNAPQTMTSGSPSLWDALSGWWHGLTGGANAAPDQPPPPAGGAQPGSVQLVPRGDGTWGTQ
jgi:hypothetical protein